MYHFHSVLYIKCVNLLRSCALQRRKNCLVFWQSWHVPWFYLETVCRFSLRKHYIFTLGNKLLCVLNEGLDVCYGLIRFLSWQSYYKRREFSILFQIFAILYDETPWKRTKNISLYKGLGWESIIFLIHC